MNQNALHKFLSFVLTLVLIFSACAKAPAATTWQEQYDLGVRYLSEGNYQEAILAFTAAIEIDPKKADAYLGLADAYVAAGDTDAAKDILQKGYDVTGDERLRKKVERGSMPSENQPGLQEELPAELWVITRQEGYLEDTNNVYYIPDRGPLWAATYEYDENGYMIRSSWRIFYDLNAPQHYVSTYKYDEASGCWYYAQRNDKGELIDEHEVEDRHRGISGAGSRLQNFALLPHLRNDRPQRMENTNPIPSDHDSYLEDWAYAEFEYDESGNATAVYSYDFSGNLLGICLMEWTVLKLGPDGTYTMK